MKKLLTLAVLAIALFACSKDDDSADLITLGVSEKTLNNQDEYQIDAISNSSIEFTSENDYNAEVSESGLVTANFIGETNIILKTSSDSKTIKITVEPRYNLYPEPDVEFGESKSSVIAKFGSDYSETENVIGYSDYSSAAPIIMFHLDEDSNLDGYSVMVESDYSALLGDFLAERYLLTDIEDDVFFFMNALDAADATMGVGIELFNLSYWMTTYFPVTSTTKKAEIRNTTVSHDFDELVEELIKK